MAKLPTSLKPLDSTSITSEAIARCQISRCATHVDSGNTATATGHTDDTCKSTVVERISCFLAGELEIPEHTPGWKVLCQSSSQTQDPLLDDLRLRTKKRPMDSSKSSAIEAKRPRTIHTREMNPKDIRIPLVWEACLLVLWEHAIKYSFITQTVCREMFVERIKRISSLALQSLKKRGFFTIKHLLGVSRAEKIYQWALDSWKCRPELFNSLSVCPTNFSPVQISSHEMIAWFCPEEPNSPMNVSAALPEVRLLFLYLDAIVRAMGAGLTNPDGSPTEINVRSWAALSVCPKQSNIGLKETGSGVHNNPSAGAQHGCQLKVVYYLNPGWKKRWGGKSVLCTRKPQLVGDVAVSHDPSPSVASAATMPTWSITPTLDRVVLLYADDRISHRVQPVLPAAELEGRLAICISYFNASQTAAFSSKKSNS